MSTPIPPTAHADRPIGAMNEPSSISFEMVYDRLKVLASRQLSAGIGNTLDTTALVHELYLRMEGDRNLTFEHSAQYFAYAARSMRHLLINRARDRMRQKAGGDWARITMSAVDDATLAVASAEQALAIDEALTQLEQTDQRAAGVFELRYFAGLPPEQIGEILGITRRTADRDWRFARAFLLAALR